MGFLILISPGRVSKMGEISIIGKLPGGSKPSLRQLEIIKELITLEGITVFQTRISTVLKMASIRIRL